MKKIITMLPVLLLMACSANNGQESKPAAMKNDNVLVAYFSVTSNTRKLANYAQEYLNSDIFEIVPAEPYTSSDVDYNSDCRANREQKDESARPEIKYEISDISRYDTIVLGYPIWWGEAPKILYSFVESYDLSNKTIIPFCTSGNSPIGNSAVNLSKSAREANWLEGKRFDANSAKEEMRNWLLTCIVEDKDMKLSIDGKELDVTWEDNASVEAQKGLCPLNVVMEAFGGFEQVGPIGQNIVSDDKRITTEPGDIVLYSSNQIVVFKASNTWAYTKLGHIGLSQDELNTVLGKDHVTLTIK